MAVASGPAALEAVRRLLGTEQVPLRTLLHDPYLPPGFSTDPLPDGATHDTLIGGYGDPERYRFADDIVCAGAEVAGAREDVCRQSLDLTMQGGTTSGVVYPLAICELATQFRFRNVGGSSVGGIAAALTAAAEVGRSSPAGRSADQTWADAPNTGFAGLAQIIAWLTADEGRLAGLFRPSTAMRGWYRLIVAALRGRWWALPTLLLAATGWAGWASIGILIGTVVGIAWLLGALTGTTIAAALPAALVDVLLAVLLGHGMIGDVSSLRTGPPPGPAWLDALGAVSSEPRSRPRVVLPAVVTVVAALALIVRPTPLLPTLVMCLAGLVLAATCLAVAVWRLLARADVWQFGLIAGSTARSGRTWTDRLAGTPSSDETALVGWLSTWLSDLAGTGGQVLRFGHLWAGAGYQPGDDVGRAADSPDHRLVNLELIATDLTRARPFRFPLRPDEEQLYCCPDELAEVFDDDVLAALRETAASTVADEDGHRRILHPLPSPADLPVVVAVRLGMGLPGLFTAVPLYRLSPGRLVTDDLGRPIAGLAEPAGPLRTWFYDGGLSSNFPVHLFDQALPRWPTVSLDVGPHRVHAPHLDVELPQDWEDSPSAPLVVGRSLPGLFLAAFRTTLSWRDRMQSDLPGFRSRIAQVHRHPGERGLNLLMPASTIASLALRGALAGVRLRTRYADPRQWDRFRWLRLRTALSITERARHRLALRAPLYADPLQSPVWLDAREAAYPYRVTWYRPGDTFWPDAATFVHRLVTAHTPTEPDPFTTDVPLPEPELRQVPRE